jgi:cytoskeletal protein CcmA (bactofilin family)
MARDKSADGGASGSLAIIGEEASMEGTLRSTAPLHLSGSFKGKIFAESELIITPTARVEARVKARKVVMAGLFIGEMVVLEDIEITATCRFLGTLIQKEPGLTVVKGGRFEGRSVFADDLEKATSDW